MKSTHLFSILRKGTSNKQTIVNFMALSRILPTSLLYPQNPRQYKPVPLQIISYNSIYYKLAPKIIFWIHERIDLVQVLEF